MIVIFGAFAGAFWGIRSARKRGGDRKDLAQYAAVGAIAGGLVGLFVTIGVERMF